MKKIRLPVICLVLSILLILSAVSVSSVLAQEIPNGPYLDEVIYAEEPDSSKALKRIEANELQLYLWYLTPEEAKTAEETPNIDLIRSACGIYNLQVNPVQFKEGFNPFAIKEVREALNWLLDRGFIADELMKGAAVPHVTLFHPLTPDYARVADYMKIVEAKYSYNPDKAREVIFDALGKAGAEYINGKWYYGGEPITITVVIRTEDVRRQIGDYVADVLESLGFEVKREYSPARKAIPLVYGGDPTAGQWNIYTEGWAFLSIAAYDDTYPEFMFVSPGSGAILSVYKPSPLLVDLASRLSTAKYKSLEERNEWIKKLTDLTIQDSLRVWLVAQLCAFPYHSDLTDIAYDLNGGPYSLFTLRTARYATGPGGTATIGNKIMFTSAWNTAPGEAGFTWLYDAVIRYQLIDPGVWPHPHTGRYIPVRAEFDVETAGPDGSLAVPADAMIWDVASQKWVEVGEGVMAKSKVTFKYTWGKWHHGQPVNIADILSGIAVTFETLSPESEIYDPNVENPTIRTFVDTFKGIKIVDDNTVEVYIDYWHPDDTFIAAQADVWEDTPWELQALMDDAYKSRELALSETTAEDLGIEWLDLTKGPSLDILAKHLDTLAAENYIPPYLEGYVTSDEAAARWNALKAWYQEKGHFFVSNGPFYLDKVNVEAKQAILKAFREYPFKADKWDFLVVPKIPEITLAPAPTVTPGLEATFEFTSTVAGEPYDKIHATYMIIDPATGEILLEGTATKVEAGKFAVQLAAEQTARLLPGSYELLLIVVGEEAALPRLASTAFTVIPAVAALEEQITHIREKVAEEIAGVNERIAGMRDEIAKSVASLEKRVIENSGVLQESVSKIQETLKGDIDKLSTRVSDVEGALSEDITSIKDDIAALNNAINILTALVAITLILSIIAIVVTIKKR